MEGDAEDRVWTTCCSKSSSSFIRYVSQLSVTLIVLTLAVGMLASGSKDTLYPSLITLCLGIYVPVPTHKPISAERPPGFRQRASTMPMSAVRSPPPFEAARSPDLLPV